MTIMNTFFLTFCVAAFLSKLVCGDEIQPLQDNETFNFEYRQENKSHYIPTVLNIKSEDPEHVEDINISGSITTSCDNLDINIDNGCLVYLKLQRNVSSVKNTIINNTENNSYYSNQCHIASDVILYKSQSMVLVVEQSECDLVDSMISLIAEIYNASLVLHFI